MVEAPIPDDFFKDFDCDTIATIFGRFKGEYSPFNLMPTHPVNALHHQESLGNRYDTFHETNVCLVEVPVILSRGGEIFEEKFKIGVRMLPSKITLCYIDKVAMIDVDFKKDHGDYWDVMELFEAFVAYAAKHEHLVVSESTVVVRTVNGVHIYIQLHDKYDQDRDWKEMAKFMTLVSDRKYILKWALDRTRGFCDKIFELRSEHITYAMTSDILFHGKQAKLVLELVHIRRRFAKCLSTAFAKDQLAANLLMSMHGDAQGLSQDRIRIAHNHLTSLIPKFSESGWVKRAFGGKSSEFSSRQMQKLLDVSFMSMVLNLATYKPPTEFVKSDHINYATVRFFSNMLLGQLPFDRLEIQRIDTNIFADYNKRHWQNKTFYLSIQTPLWRKACVRHRLIRRLGKAYKQCSDNLLEFFDSLRFLGSNRPIDGDGSSLVAHVFEKLKQLDANERTLLEKLFLTIDAGEYVNKILRAYKSARETWGEEDGMLYINLLYSPYADLTKLLENEKAIVFIRKSSRERDIRGIFRRGLAERGIFDQLVRIDSDLANASSLAKASPDQNALGVISFESKRELLKRLCVFMDTLTTNDDRDVQNMCTLSEHAKDILEHCDSAPDENAFVAYCEDGRAEPAIPEAAAAARAAGGFFRAAQDVGDPVFQDAEDRRPPVCASFPVEDCPESECRVHLTSNPKLIAYTYADVDAFTQPFGSPINILARSIKTHTNRVIHPEAAREYGDIADFPKILLARVDFIIDELFAFHFTRNEELLPITEVIVRYNAHAAPMRDLVRNGACLEWFIREVGEYIKSVMDAGTNTDTVPKVEDDMPAYEKAFNLAKSLASTTFRQERDRLGEENAALTNRRAVDSIKPVNFIEAVLNKHYKHKDEILQMANYTCDDNMKCTPISEFDFLETVCGQAVADADFDDKYCAENCDVDHTWSATVECKKEEDWKCEQTEKAPPCQ